ncbi:MAG: hypothetical protein LBL18_02110 [Bacteroidales bacterium]|jgi:hypothetical protein|nr:hypothetical protein [Bacteroidales bacterium]
MSLGDPYPATQIVFSNGITMGPLEIKVWIKLPYDVYDWTSVYAETYQVPNQFAYLYTKEYEGNYEFQLYFLRITSQNYHQPKKQTKINKVINL